MCLASIIIRCYNEEKHIGQLLDGIKLQTIKNIEIMVVDSGSNDATLSIASRYPVRILSILPEEFSFGRALNIACQVARGEFIVIASAHVYPLYKDWLMQMLEPFSDPRVALVYGKQKGNQITKFSENQIFSRWFPDESSLNQDSPFCNNANAAIRHAIWKQLPYDETLTGLEDIDWAKRTMDLGYRIAYVAEAEVIHIHDESPLRIYNRYRREAIALKHIFPQERFTIWDFVRLFVVNVGIDWYSSWSRRVFWRSFFDIVIFRFMQFLGTYRGFMQRGPISYRLKKIFYYPNNLEKQKTQLIKFEHKRPKIDYGKNYREN